MFNASVIRKTGQWWKLVVSMAATVTGGIGMFVARQEMSASAAWLPLAMMLGGIGLCLGGLVFACVSIRCPRCRAHWFWAAVSRRASGEWLPWLLSHPTCPNCSFPDETVSRATERAA
jgi:hypothetical protein